MQTRTILIENIPCIISRDKIVGVFVSCGKILTVEEFVLAPNSLTYHLGIIFSTTTAVRLALTMNGKAVHGYAIIVTAVFDYNKWCGYVHNANRMFYQPQY
jgi:hypothetical protein